MPMSSEAIGLIAGTLTTFSFLPQVIKTYRSRSSGDLSFGMLGLFSLGVSLWLLYGVLIGSRPIMLSNFLTLLLTLALVAMKIGFQRRASRRTAMKRRG